MSQRDSVSDHDDPGDNVIDVDFDDRPSMGPVAHEALSERTAHKQAADRHDIEMLYDKVANLTSGETPWQQHVERTLSMVVSELQSMRRCRDSWPRFSILAACVFGTGFGALAGVLLALVIAGHR